MEARFYQEECPVALRKHLRKNNPGNPLIVLPTGSGKTYAINLMIQALLDINDEYKIVVVSHVKEILDHISKSLSMSSIKHGINSASVGRREVEQITICGIQSVYKNKRLQNPDFIFVDECHMIPPSDEEKTMYCQFLSASEDSMVIGTTATPYRLGQGYIYGRKSNHWFSKVIVDYGSPEGFKKILDAGYLTPLVTKATSLEMDVSDIKLKGGEYNEKELSDKFDREPVTKAAIKEIIAKGQDREKWLIFAIDIDHAESIAETLIQNGIPTAPVHSKMKEYGFDREKVLEGFHNGKYRCVVNVNILTTGFDEPGIDLIACLRPTNSPTLHVQSNGRGSRIYTGKTNCLILDFAGNTCRLGTIDNPIVKTKGRAGEGGEPITKTCPVCSSILAPAVRVCPDCGNKFKFQHGLSSAAYQDISIEEGESKWLDVHGVRYEKDFRPGAPSMVKVIYNCSGFPITEYVCIEHPGFAGKKARHWVKYRGGTHCSSADDLICISHMLKVPNKINVAKKGKYFSIRESKFLDVDS